MSNFAPSTNVISFYLEELIWGHRFHDEQTTPMIGMEFLNVLQNKSFREYINRNNPAESTLVYSSRRNFALRTLLFNNPYIEHISRSVQQPWKVWAENFAPDRVSDGQGASRTTRELLTAFSDPESGRWNHEYLIRAFNDGSLCDDWDSFNNFANTLRLIRSCSFNIHTNKRWTSLFVFPWGSDCLFAETDERGSPDKRFFGRSGELLFVLLSYADHCDDLEVLVKKRYLGRSHPLNRVCRVLSGPYGDKSLENRGCHGPEMVTEVTRARANLLCNDLIAMLGAKLPSEDLFLHLCRIIGLHLICYFFERAVEVTQKEFYEGLPVNQDVIKNGFAFPCEILAQSSNGLRQLSKDVYVANRGLSLVALKSFINHRAEEIKRECLDELGISEGEAAEDEIFQNKYREKFIKYFRVAREEILKELEDPEGETGGNLKDRFFERAKVRHAGHWAKVPHAFGRTIGLASPLGTNAYRYCPEDALLISLILANVEGKRMLLDDFLWKLFEKYHIIIGHVVSQALHQEINNDDWAENVTRLKERLKKLGMLESLSDGFDYVTNSFYAEKAVEEK